VCFEFCLWVYFESSQCDFESVKWVLSDKVGMYSVVMVSCGLAIRQSHIFIADKSAGL